MMSHILKVEVRQVELDGPQQNEIGNKICFSFATGPGCEYEIAVAYP